MNAAAADLFPAVLEQLRVDRGFETALGAALGEDLDIPLDRSAPAHWGDIGPDASDPALPEGVTSLASVVRAPRQLARRLAQIGICEPAVGAALQAKLRPGQRLVTREGALWRWDGYTASADAPTAAAQRLAQKNRLAELEAEATDATRKVRGTEAALEAAGRRGGSRRPKKPAARPGAWRSALGEARDALEKAERSAGELTSRRAALGQARGRRQTRDGRRRPTRSRTRALGGARPVGSPGEAGAPDGRGGA